MESTLRAIKLTTEPDDDRKAAVRRLQLSGALRFLTAGNDANSVSRANEFGGTTTISTASRPDDAGFLVETSTVMSDSSGAVIKHEFVRVWTRRD